ncbi:MAG: hypothetical protein KDD15_10980 [Lewinella sp.]|nr:hypothetical protein [Lewinella sp.]
MDLDLVELASLKAKRTRILREMQNEAFVSRSKLKAFISQRSSSKLKVLKVILRELLQNEISTLVKKLIGFLGCKHKLRKHQPALNFFAVTLASIYRFNGFSIRDAKNRFDSIFSKNLHHFPFPSHIDQIPDKEDRERVMREYLDGRTFAQQFTGIVDGFRSDPFEITFVVKILNVELEKDVNVDFLYDGARIIDPNHDLVLKIKKVISKDEYLDDFLNHENFLICLIQSKISSNVRDFREKIYEQLQSVVDYLNGRTRSVKAVADRSEYLATRDFKKFSSGFSSNYPNVQLDKSYTKLLEDNASSYLKGINKRLKHTLLYTEDLFWKGIIFTDLVKLWQYLENTTPVINTSKGEERLVCETVRNILLFRHEHICQSLYVQDFVNVISNMSAYDVNEFPDEVVKQYRKREYSQISPHLATKHSKNPFVKSIGINWKKDKSRSSQQSFADHWNHILVEARAYRNMIMHDGRANELLRRKLEVCLPYLTLNYRYTCIDLVLANGKRSDYDKLVSSKVKQKNL